MDLASRGSTHDADGTYARHRSMVAVALRYADLGSLARRREVAGPKTSPKLRRDRDRKEARGCNDVLSTRGEGMMHGHCAQ